MFPINSIPEGRYVSPMQGQLVQWLELSDWKPEQLVDWLRGYDLPPVGHEEEPYLVLLDGLPGGDHQFKAETELARRVALILTEKPDLHWSGKRWEQVLYNLLMLSAGLGCPDQLAAPLYEMMERQKLQGRWLGVDLQNCLRSALVENQLDSRLERTWLAMIEGDAKGFLPANAYVGFDGILLMPPSLKHRGQPAIAAIGRALAGMARFLEQHRDRRLRLCALIEKVKTTYPGRPTWDLEFIEMADIEAWPTWAVWLLPSLCIRAETSDRGSGHFYLLNLYLDILQEDKNAYETHRALCNGQVADVYLEERAVDFAIPIIRSVEHARLKNPFQRLDEKSVLGIVAHELEQARLEMMQKNPGLARCIKETKESVVEKAMAAKA